MSRENDGTVIPMTAMRRDDIRKEFSGALRDIALFDGETFFVTVVRCDGEGFQELACALVREGQSAVRQPGIAKDTRP